MNASAPVPAAPPATGAGTAAGAPEKDRTRFLAVLSAALFVPAAVLAGVLTLASYRASRCLTYGEQCSPGLPGWVFWAGAGAAAAGLVVALVASAARVRKVAFAAQVLAECTALLVILSHA
ncbi:MULTISPECIES: hypothetical protein [unclassified Streptomyces]|uniref:hypothetical protein n=1 Tax=unclassified Streptomyces TaxID=2593676 RepID=UPI0038262746